MIFPKNSSNLGSTVLYLGWFKESWTIWAILPSTWRIIPVSKWLVTPIYKPFRPFISGIPHLGDLLTMVINHLLTGMILPVCECIFTYFQVIYLHPWDWIIYICLSWMLSGQFMKSILKLNVFLAILGSGIPLLFAIYLLGWPTGWFFPLINAYVGVIWVELSTNAWVVPQNTGFQWIPWRSIKKVPSSKVVMWWWFWAGFPY